MKKSLFTALSFAALAICSCGGGGVPHIIIDEDLSSPWSAAQSSGESSSNPAPQSSSKVDSRSASFSSMPQHSATSSSNYSFPSSNQTTVPSSSSMNTGHSSTVSSSVASSSSSNGYASSVSSSSSIITYAITYELNGGTNDPSNPSSYTGLVDVVFEPPSRAGYSFDFWRANGYPCPSQSIPAGTTGDIVMTAYWLPDSQDLSVSSSAESKGTVEIIEGGIGLTDETITVQATPRHDCVFEGWYHDDQKVSNFKTFSFNMPIGGYSLVAKFMTKDEATGIVPILSAGGKKLTYGLYPQENINDADLLNTLNGLTTPGNNGWYLNQGKYYAKLIATPYSSYVFDNGETITGGSTYWFRCEPITWTVLSSSDNTYYLLSDSLLDVQRYDDSSNNYRESEIRAWLNGDFLSTAFALDDSYILTTDVDNRASTTGSDSNPYASANTQDKVFLPSYSDYTKAAYGFDAPAGSVSTARQSKTTDWARARGACCMTNSTYLNNGYYWTRSPYDLYANSAWFVRYDGSMFNYNVRSYYGNDNCVRPAIRITL